MSGALHIRPNDACNFQVAAILLLTSFFGKEISSLIMVSQFLDFKIRIAAFPPESTIKSYNMS